MAAPQVRDVVEDHRYGRRYAVVAVALNGALTLRDVATKVQYEAVPPDDVAVVPGLRERA